MVGAAPGRVRVRRPGAAARAGAAARRRAARIPAAAGAAARMRAAGQAPPRARARGRVRFRAAGAAARGPLSGAGRRGWSPCIAIGRRRGRASARRRHRPNSSRRLAWPATVARISGPDRRLLDRTRRSGDRWRRIPSGSPTGCRPPGRRAATDRARQPVRVSRRVPPRSRSFEYCCRSEFPDPRCSLPSHRLHRGPGPPSSRLPHGCSQPTRLDRTTTGQGRYLYTMVARCLLDRDPHLHRVGIGVVQRLGDQRAQIELRSGRGDRFGERAQPGQQRGELGAELVQLGGELL